jgi:hypothetical protein
MNEGFLDSFYLELNPDKDVYFAQIFVHIKGHFTKKSKVVVTIATYTKSGQVIRYSQNDKKFWEYINAYSSEIKKYLRGERSWQLK